MSDSEKGPDPAMDVDREDDEIAAIKDEMKEKVKDEVSGSTHVIPFSGEPDLTFSPRHPHGRATMGAMMRRSTRKRRRRR